MRQEAKVELDDTSGSSVALQEVDKLEEETVNHCQSPENVATHKPRSDSPSTRGELVCAVAADAAAITTKLLVAYRILLGCMIQLGLLKRLFVVRVCQVVGSAGQYVV